MRVNQKMLWICSGATGGTSRPRRGPNPQQEISILGANQTPLRVSLADPSAGTLGKQKVNLDAVRGLRIRMFEAPPPAPVSLSFKANFFIAIVALTGGWCAIFLLAGHDPALHTVLDTSVALTGALIALLLWDISRRT